MKTLEKNITNLFGQKGVQWLHNLPTIVDKLSELWTLTDVKPVNNMSWNYVATALQHNEIPVVLKISCDQQLILDEYKALKHFDGHGSIQVLDINTECNALLLEQAIPGKLLKDSHPANPIDTINIYANVVKQLATRPLPKYSDVKHVSEWLKAIDRITDNRVEKRFIDRAKELRLKVLSTAKHEYLCHGDLHLENIISHRSNWLAIDPKGIIGEMSFEAAAFDLISTEEIKEKPEENLSLILDRATLLSKALDLNFDRLLSWIFLRIILSAQWFIEDNGDPNYMLSLARYIYPFKGKLKDACKY